MAAAGGLAASAAPLRWEAPGKYALELCQALLCLASREVGAVHFQLPSGEAKWQVPRKLFAILASKNHQMSFRGITCFRLFSKLGESPQCPSKKAFIYEKQFEDV